MVDIREARLAVVVACLLLLACDASAETVANPLPLLVVRDGDGKTVGQVLDLRCGGEWLNNCYPVIALNIVGEPALVRVDTWGPTMPVYFASTNCLGAAYLSSYVNALVSWNTQVGVVGPDPSLGTYTVYRATSTTPASVTTFSWWTPTAPECQNYTQTGSRYPAEEVTPNPLGGFHGPTLSEPDKKWSVAGGTKITPP